MICPVCRGKQIGKVGVEQYYCWNCCVEFNSVTDQVVVYDLDEDGTLIAWDDFYLDSQEVIEAVVE